MAYLPGRVVPYATSLDTIIRTSYVVGAPEVSLFTSAYVPNTSDAYLVELRGEVHGGGYTRRKLQGREVLFDEAVQRFQFKATRVEFPQVTLSARWAVISLNDGSGDPDLLGWVDLYGNRQVFNATFSVSWENDMILEVQGV